jgi:polysaccharide pyruvyl transferase WcaK-like protein
MTHIVIAADIGSPVRHIGDEAMFDALVERLRDRQADVQVTVLSNDPEAVGRRHGVEFAPKVLFAGGREREADREQQLRCVLDTARAARNAHANGSSEEARRFVELVRGADAVVVAGGGNLTSLWPEYVYERVALLRVASILDRPIVVTGQSIGPALSARESSLLGEALAGANLVCVRERASQRMCLRLGVDPARLMLAPDDAMTLEARRDSGVEEALGIDLENPWIGVTITAGSLEPSVNRDAKARDLASRLAELADACEAPLVLLPHFSYPNANSSGDIDVAREVASAIGLVNPKVTVAVAPIGSPRGMAWLTGRAALVVSARYQGLVFGQAAAVPVLAIHDSEYVRSKMQGLLDLAGVGGWRLPAEALADRTFLDAVMETWSRRQDLHDHLSARAAELRAAGEQHWAIVGAALGLNPPPAENPELSDGEEGPQPLGAWLGRRDGLELARSQAGS